VASNLPTADLVLTQGHIRGFIQYGGAAPGNEAQYYGIRNQYFAITGISNPQRGSISPINVQDPQRRKLYSRIGRTVEAPDLPEYTLTVMHKHGTVPKALGVIGCPITTYLSAGRCKDPSDLNRGWQSYMYILGGGEVTDSSPGDMNALDSDEMIATELTITATNLYPVGALSFGETASAEVNAEVIDIVYDNPRACLGCDEGISRIYAVTRAIGGSPNFQAEVVYSVDSGATWTNVNITGLGATLSPTAIDIVGDYLVVLVAGTTDSIFYALLNEDTGVPGTWTQVTSGFVAAGSPNDLYVAGPSEVYIVGDAGYIYRSRDITEGVSVLSAGTATSQDLRRVHGDGQGTIIAVGETGAIVRSINGGATWATTTTSPTSATVTAIQVLTDKLYWIGTSGGKVYYTKNGGANIGGVAGWTEQSPASAVEIQDILFPTAEVGYISYTVSGPDARIATTLDGGDTWIVGPARVAGSYPTHDRSNRLAAPSGTPIYAANYLAVGGLAGDGSEGIILVGAANLL